MVAPSSIIHTHSPEYICLSTTEKSTTK